MSPIMRMDRDEYCAVRPRRIILDRCGCGPGRDDTKLYRREIAAVMGKANGLSHTSGLTYSAAMINFDTVATLRVRIGSSAANRGV